MACELLQLLSPHNYTELVQHLTNKDIFAQKLFELTELSETHWLDTRKCYRQRRKNTHQVFELFGSFNDEHPIKVRKDTIHHICQNKAYYANVGCEHLKCIKLSINKWLLLMTLESVFGDELMIFALSKIYQHHTVIFTSRSCWTTIGSDEPIDGNRLLEICQVHLLHIGLHMYAEIKPKPFVPVTKKVVTEAPIVVIPILHDDSSDTDAAMDLSLKQPNGGDDNASTTTGDPSDTPFDDKVSTTLGDLSDTQFDRSNPHGIIKTSCEKETSDITNEYDDNSELSDSLSESLLPKYPTAGSFGVSSTLGINDECNKYTEETTQNNASSNAKKINSMGINLESSGSETWETTQHDVLGTNLSTDSSLVDEMGTNIDKYFENNSNGVMQGTATGMAEQQSHPSTYLTPDAHHDTSVNQTTEHEQHAFDPYNDAPLSGVLEKLSIKEWMVVDVLLSLPNTTENIAPKGIANTHSIAHNQMQETDPAQQTPVPMENSINKSTLQDTDSSTELTNTMEHAAHVFDSDHLYCSLCNHTASEVTLSPKSLQTEGRELELLENPDSDVSPDCMEIDMTSHDLMLNPITTNHCETVVLGINVHTEPASVLGIVKTGINELDECSTIKSVIGINTSVPPELAADSQSPQSVDTNEKEDHISVTSIIETSCDHRSDVPGINRKTQLHGSISSSSNFEGFTSDDIVQHPARIHNMSNISSDELTYSDFTYEDTVEDSSDTTPASENIPIMENMKDLNSDLQDLFLVRNQLVDMSILEMWIEDAKTKKWDIPLCKLTAREVYDLSHPPPKWDEIDLYSSLEELSAGQNDILTPEESLVASKRDSHYNTRKKTIHGKITRKSNCIAGKCTVYYDSNSHSSDSDFTPKPKTLKNPNVGLRSPSLNHIKAQREIKSRRMAQGFIHIDDSEKEKILSLLYRNFLLHRGSENTHRPHPCKHC